MEEKEWKLCLRCGKAVYDKEDGSCFVCQSKDAQMINKSQLIEMKEKNPKSGIIIQSRYWGDIC